MTNLVMLVVLVMLIFGIGWCIGWLSHDAFGSPKIHIEDDEDDEDETPYLRLWAHGADAKQSAEIFSAAVGAAMDIAPAHVSVGGFSVLGPGAPEGEDSTSEEEPEVKRA